MEAGIDGGAIPPAALLTLLQKGIHYTEAELCAVGDDGVERTLVEPLSLIEAVMPDIVASKVREKVPDKQTPSTSKGDQSGHGSTNHHPRAHHYNHVERGGAGGVGHVPNGLSLLFYSYGLSILSLSRGILYHNRFYGEYISIDNIIVAESSV